ncbi:SRPBCC family protein [Aureitalea marina]|uniref:Polyketide cyclase n=1 Tax=Aureitalea marina TaxID=930804 RepID=A0A2S7KPR5_9FLAO|nr:SRPBCC family protein [Aureitalea marina]PQB04563.1 polyketide cyclase [Aureitalea marina]
MIFLYILGAIVAIVVILAIAAPKNYNVSRSITINKARSEVFPYIRYVKNQDNWSPWKKKDSNMKQEFIGNDGDVGFVSKWEGNKQVGTGQQEIVEILDGRTLRTKLTFLKPWESQSDAYITCSDEGSGTKVEWGFSGRHKVPANIFMLFMNMDKAVGKDFNEGLAELKSILESN